MSSMNKAKMLEKLYPEDLLKYSEKLTEKEVHLLVKLREILETKLEPVIEDYWKNETFPFEEFKEITDLGLMNHPDLFVGREGEHKVSEHFNMRSEERRVGKECRIRWATGALKQ